MQLLRHFFSGLKTDRLSLSTFGQTVIIIFFLKTVLIPYPLCEVFSRFSPFRPSLPALLRQRIARWPRLSGEAGRDGWHRGAHGTVARGAQGMVLTPGVTPLSLFAPAKDGGRPRSLLAVRRAREPEVFGTGGVWNPRCCLFPRRDATGDVRPAPPLLG